MGRGVQPIYRKGEREDRVDGEAKVKAACNILAKKKRSMVAPVVSGIEKPCRTGEAAAPLVRHSICGDAGGEEKSYMLSLGKIRKHKHALGERRGDSEVLHHKTWS